MAQYWWQPNPDDLGSSPSDLTFSSVFSGIVSAEVSPNPNGYTDPLPLRVRAATSATVTLRGIAIDSIYGFDISNLSGEVELYWHFRTVGASTDGFATAFIRPDGVAPVVAFLRSRAGSDWQHAIRHFTSNTAMTVLDGSSEGHNTDLVQTKMRVGFHPAANFTRSKLWYPETADVEPDAWQISGIYPSNAPASGRIGFGRRRHTADATFTLDIFGFGIGTDGDPAPTGPVAHGLPTLSDPMLDDIAPWAGTPKVMLGYM